MKKKVYVFSEKGWAVGRIHRDLEKYLSDEFEFTFADWGDQDDMYKKMKAYEDCDIFLSLLITYHYIPMWWPNMNFSRCLFVAHGFEEFTVTLHPEATHAMTSKSIAHLFPENIKPLLTPNCVELDNFIYKEHSGSTDVIGWCGAPNVWFKQFEWAKEITKRLETELVISAKYPFEDKRDWVALSHEDLKIWFTKIDILLITSIPNGQSETGPLPAFEAIASGVVVIGTPVGNFAEVPGPKFKTIAEAVEILKELKNNPEKVKQIAKEQYQSIVEKWNYKVASKYWRDAFHTVLKKNIKKVFVFGPIGWSVERVHRDVERYLTDDFEFTYFDWRETDLGTIADISASYDLCLTQIATVNFFASNSINVDFRKWFAVAHGSCEFKDIVLPDVPVNYGMTSYEISHLFPPSRPVFIVRNGVEPSHFEYIERTGEIHRLGWCGDINIPTKNYPLATKISEGVNLVLDTAMSIPFHEMKIWYHSIDILLITAGPDISVETGPLPAFEAIVSGVLVIGSRVGNFSKIPGPKFSTLEEAVEIINKLKTDPAEVKRLAKMQYDCVIQNWTYKDISNEWRSAFNTILSNNAL